MEQIKETEKIRMIDPIEGNTNHLEAHEKLNEAVTQFYGLFNDLIEECNLLAQKDEDAKEINFASFSKLEDNIKELRREIKSLATDIEKINRKLDEGGKFLTVRYDGIVDTDTETTVELDAITDEDLRGRQYLTSIAIHEVQPNQGAEEYKLPQPSLVFDEYKPRIYLKAKAGEHAVLEYNFTLILTEV